MRKSIFIVAIALFVVSVGFAAEDAWMSDLSEAKKVATEKKLPIFALFTGTTWCPFCVKFEKEIISQKTFLDYAQKNYVLYSMDVPKNPDNITPGNLKLLQEYKIQGFPTVLILDKDGKYIYHSSYRPGGAEKYVKFLKEEVAKAKRGKIKTGLQKVPKKAATK